MARKNQLIDVDLNGKLLMTTDVVITMPETVSAVEIHQLDDGRFRAVKGDLTADGDTLEDSIKSFKRRYKNQ